jgi:hypothetical protein
MSVDNQFRSAAQRLISETSGAATEGRLDRITREKRPAVQVLVVIAVVVIPVLFALFGWLNAQPTSDQRYGPAISPNTLAPTSTTQAPTGGAPTTDVSPYTPERGFVDVQLEDPGVRIKGLHVGETTEGFPVAAYVRDQQVRMAICADIVCLSDVTRVDLFTGAGSYTDLRDFVVSTDGRAVALVEEWAGYPGGESLTQYLVRCLDSRCSAKTMFVLEADEFLTYSDLALDGEDVLVSYNEFRDGGQPVAGVVRCSTALGCTSEIESEAGGGGMVAISGGGRVILLSQEEAVPASGRFSLRPCGESRCEFGTKSGGAILGLDVVMSLEDAPRVVVRSVIGDTEASHNDIRWELQLIACRDSECEAANELTLHEGGEVEWDVSTDRLGNPVVAWVADGRVRVARCATNECLDMLVGEPVATECACGVAVFAADDDWIMLLVATEDEGLKLVVTQFGFESSPQEVIAEPQPACNGETSLGGASGDAGGAEEEDAPPAPPVLIPAGPCAGIWTTYTQEHGLPWCVCGLGVSRDGTAWVLSELGDIATFNGTTWTTLDTGGREVRALDFAQDGTLWIATDRGVWAREAGGWIQKGDTPGDDIAASPDGSVWVYSDETLLQFDGSSWTEHALSVDSLPSTEGVDVNVIEVAADGTLWLGADSTFASYDGTTWTSHSPAPRFTPYGMTVGPDGSVWMASTSNSAIGGPVGAELHTDGYGLVRYDGAAWVEYPIPSFVDIAFASDGTIWVADSNIGAFRFDGQGWVHYTEEHGLAANSLDMVAVAPDGTVWFKTLFGDVVRYQPTS